MMSYSCFLHLCSLKKVFAFFCAMLTLFLICQEFITFAVERPTTTSIVENPLKMTDLPEVVICLEHGFHTDVLEKYGYNPRSYAMGKTDFWEKFTGWNGRKEETKSSREIVEEALIVNSQHISKTKFGPCRELLKILS